MAADWASENLQVIRTLMERSALYRRALAPVMFSIGTIGLVGSIIPCFLSIKTNTVFTAYWMVISVLALSVTLLLVRRQSLREGDPFWSGPTRRVTSALMPAFFMGLVAGVFFLCPHLIAPGQAWILVPVWMCCYGGGLHAAGFFMQRGIKLLGWIFIIGGASALGLFFSVPGFQTAEIAHYVMGIFFGLVHLAAGIYLSWTERRKNAG